MKSKTSKGNKGLVRKIKPCKIKMLSFLGFNKRINDFKNKPKSVDLSDEIIVVDFPLFIYS